jgi:GAF domain-containing protein
MAGRLRELIESLEERVSDRTRSLQAAADVSRATTSLRDPDELLRQVVNLVQDRFDLYYVGLFLVDEVRQWAVLRAGTGDAGQTMIAQGHRLAVAGDSMIGRCVANDQARIALDVGQEPVRFENPLLPETRSEMALPLHSRGQVIGAMTVQSAVEAAFDEADIAVMQTMADQVAIAIDNARLFVETQAALKEMEATHRQYLREAWAGYVPAASTTYYETAPLEKKAEGRSALVSPITLRGEEIGSLGIQDDSGTRQWTTEETALVQAVTNRLALAAENLRLLEETRRRAAQEQLVGEVTARIRHTLDVDAVLDTAVDEIARVFGLAALDLRLGPTMPEVSVPEVEQSGTASPEERGLDGAPRNRQGKRQDGDSE